MATPLESHTPLSLTWVCRASCMGGGEEQGCRPHRGETVASTLAEAPARARSREAGA